MITRISKSGAGEISPREFSKGLREIIGVEGVFPTGPELDDKLPDWIPEIHQELHSLLGDFSQKHGLYLSGVKSLEKHQSRNGITRFVGISEAIDDCARKVGYIIVSNQNICIHSPGEEDFYLAAPVYSRIVVPMGKFKDSSSKLLEEYCKLIKYLDSDLNLKGDPSAVYRQISPFHKYFTPQFQLAQTGRTVLNDLGINTENIETFYNF